MNTIFKLLHGIMVTLTLQISKSTKAVVFNSFPHGRFWQFAYKEIVLNIIYICVCVIFVDIIICVLFVGRGQSISCDNFLSNPIAVLFAMK
jgi:hypothetical protein